jgi:hypothetical protein
MTGGPKRRLIRYYTSHIIFILSDGLFLLFPVEFNVSAIFAAIGLNSVSVFLQSFGFGRVHLKASSKASLEPSTSFQSVWDIF